MIVYRVIQQVLINTYPDCLHHFPKGIVLLIIQSLPMLPLDALYLANLVCILRV